MEVDAVRLRELREEQVLSLRELEDMSGVSYNTIWRLEDGELEGDMRRVSGRTCDDEPSKRHSRHHHDQ